jgi:sporulation protein YlmC with PRC-barrel domain
MPVEAVKFRFGTTVLASDGEAGTVTSVIVQPGNRTVTHFGAKLPGGKQVAVPRERVVDALADTVQLDITREALSQTLPDISPNDITLSRNTRIGGARNLGTLTQVTVVFESGVIRTIGVKGGGEVLINASAIQDIDNQKITVASDKVDWPSYRPDGELLEECQQRLYNYPRLRVDLAAVHLRALDGELWVQGHVFSTLNRRIVAELLVGTKGLLSVHNSLIADNELAIEIARALAKDPRTHGQPIGVYPTLGRVYLRGLTHTDQAAIAATEIAGAIGGTVEVVNDLTTQQSQFIPMLAPITGDEDTVPGGA